MATYQDSFTLHGGESAGEDLAAHTSAESGDAWANLDVPTLTVTAAGRVASGSAAWRYYQFGRPTQAADALVSVRAVVNVASFEAVGVFARCNGTLTVGYACAYFDNGLLRLQKLSDVAAGGTLATVTLAAPANGSSLWLRLGAVGSLLTVDTSPDGTTWTPRLSAADATYPAGGHAGVMAYGSDSDTIGMELDDFSLTDFPAPPLRRGGPGRRRARLPMEKRLDFPLPTRKPE